MVGLGGCAREFAIRINRSISVRSVPLDVPAMPRGWLRHPGRLAVARVIRSINSGLAPRRGDDDIDHDFRDIIITATVNMQPRIILTQVILDQRDFWMSTFKSPFRKRELA